MDGKAIPVGSFAFWLVWKVATVLVLAFGSAVTFSSRDPYGFILLFIGLAIVAVSNEELVYGQATEDRIHFRRYFKMQFVPWTAIRSITWSASDRLQIKLKRAWFLRRTLAAQSFGNSSDSISERLSSPPDVVRWLLMTKPIAADGIELIGPGV